MSTKRLNAIVTIGGAVSSSFNAAFGGAKGRVGELGNAIRDAERRQKLLGKAITDMRGAGLSVDGLRRSYESTTQAIARQRAELGRLQAAQAGMAAGRASMAGGGAILGAIAAAGATLGAPVVQAVEFETAMLGVAKQVNGARDSSGKLTATYYEMARAVQGLGREIPIATNELAGMVAAGARMGVEKENLIDFTKTVSMMAAAFDGINSEELADNMGKIAGLFKIPIPEIGRLADSINYLDDNAISKGADIINVLQRIGGTAQTLRMSAADAAALGSTFLTLGASAEIAATASNAVMRELSIANMQPKRFQAGLKAIGMDAKKIQADMAKDATGTILKVLDALRKVPEARRMEVTTQLFGKEYGDDVAKLAEGVDEYRRQLQLASSAEARGSMSREFEAKRATTAAQWQLMKNRVGELAVNIGSVLLPAVNNLFGGLAPVVTSMADWARGNGAIIGQVVTLVGTLGGLTVGVKLASMGFGALLWAFSAVKVAMLSNPFTAVAILAATAAVMVWKNWEPIAGWFAGAWAHIKDTAQAAVDLVKAGWGGLRDWFASLWTDIVSGARTAFAWITDKVDAIGRAWGAAKGVFSGAPAPTVQIGAAAAPGGPQAAPQAPAEGQAPPAVPRAPGRGSVVIQRAGDTYNVTQQPGQDARALADEIARRQRERDEVERRSMMRDTVGAY